MYTLYIFFKNVEAPLKISLPSQTAKTDVMTAINMSIIDGSTTTVIKDNFGKVSAVITIDQIRAVS